VTERRLSVCLSYDVSTMAVWPTAFGLGSSTMRSRGEFGAFAMPRILESLERHEIEATFFVPEFTAAAYPQLVRSVARGGHEIGYRGCLDGGGSSGGFSTESFDSQRREFARGLAFVAELAGAPPTGFRSQCSDLSAEGIGLLLNSGVVYDASHSATDFHPYYLRQGDVWSPVAPYVFGTVTELVAMPFSYGLSDFPHFEFVPGWATNLLAPATVEEIWRSEFDFAYERCCGGVYVLSLEPQVIGRGSRLAMLERLLGHIASHEGIVFEPMGRFAQRWKQENPVREWVRGNRALAGTDALSSSDDQTDLPTDIPAR
jgi:peptidoglycan/xylan/chitin deacetylase (PgdA/CDA1 family)